jgi:hypothetical protein
MEQKQTGSRISPNSARTGEEFNRHMRMSLTAKGPLAGVSKLASVGIMTLALTTGAPATNARADTGDFQEDITVVRTDKRGGLLEGTFLGGAIVIVAVAAMAGVRFIRKKDEPDEKQKHGGAAQHK